MDMRAGRPRPIRAVFDTSSGKSWDEKLYNRDVQFDGRTIHVVGL